MLKHSRISPNSILRRVVPCRPISYDLYIGLFLPFWLFRRVLAFFFAVLLSDKVRSGAHPGLFNTTFLAKMPTYSRGVPETVNGFRRFGRLSGLDSDCTREAVAREAKCRTRSPRFPQNR